jgi:hypothetical protein
MGIGEKMKINISVEWWNADDRSEPKRAHKEELVESALKKVPGMILEGYTSGQLLENLCVSDKDPNEGVNYQGAWILFSESN